jgi:hypothetical protein
MDLRGKTNDRGLVPEIGRAATELASIQHDFVRPASCSVRMVASACALHVVKPASPDSLCRWILL